MRAPAQVQPLTPAGAPEIHRVEEQGAAEIVGEPRPCSGAEIPGFKRRIRVLTNGFGGHPAHPFVDLRQDAAPHLRLSHQFSPLSVEPGLLLQVAGRLIGPQFSPVGEGERGADALTQGVNNGLHLVVAFVFRHDCISQPLIGEYDKGACRTHPSLNRTATELPDCLFKTCCAFCAHCLPLHSAGEHRRPQEAAGRLRVCGVAKLDAVKIGGADELLRNVVNAATVLGFRKGGISQITAPVERGICFIHAAAVVGIPYMCGFPNLHRGTVCAPAHCQVRPVPVFAVINLAAVRAPR